MTCRIATGEITGARVLESSRHDPVSSGARAAMDEGCRRIVRSVLHVSLLRKRFVGAGKKIFLRADASPAPTFRS